MGFGPFSSDSKTKQTTTDKSIQVADQGIAYQPISSNNPRSSIRVGKGASLVVNNGLSAEDFNAGLSALADSLHAGGDANPDHDEQAFNQAVLSALERRTEANTDRAVDEVKTGAPSAIGKYVLWGVGLVVVFAIALVLRKSK